MVQRTDAPQDAPAAATIVGSMLSIPEMTAVLIQSRGLHEGFFELAITFRIGVGAVANGDGQKSLPGAVFGVEAFGLQAVARPSDNPNVVDASVVNPRPASRRPAAKKSGRAE